MSLALFTAFERFLDRTAVAVTVALGLVLGAAVALVA
jgi:hypothetical protein